jgi:hypothetical protein
MLTPRRLRLFGAVVLALASSLGAAGVAAAAPPPAVVTGAVTAFASTSATVTGAVNPNGQPTSSYFEYGRNTHYGSKTAATDAGTGTAAVGVSATITDLAPSMTYHYRFVAANGSGVSHGADGTFTTSPAPAPDVATGGASGVSATAATLTGAVNPNGRPTSWFFEYGTSAGYGSRTPAQNAGASTTAVGVSAPVARLQTGRTYHFRLVAQSDGGTSRGGDQTFTPAAAPAATTRGASSVSAGGARLSGVVHPNGQETSWHFDYGTSTDYGSSTPARRAGSGTRSSGVSESISGLASGTTYHFRLVASNASGTTVGADQAFTTVGAPVAQTGGAQAIGTTTATMTGAVDPKNHTTGWYFEYGLTAGYGTRTPWQRADANTGNRPVSAVLAGLAPGTTYHYRIVAASSAGTSRGVDVAFTTVANWVTVKAQGLEAVYGRFVMLTGAASTGQPGVSVAVLAQKFGDGSFTTVATVLTGAGGRWTYLAQPTIRTTYEASANGVTSSNVTVGVRPAVSLRLIRRARLSTHVGAGTSFAGRFVQLQRLSHGRWKTLKRARLNARSSAAFRAAVLPKGRSTVRIAMSVNQAGPGFLAGFSRKLTYRR